VVQGLLQVALIILEKLPAVGQQSPLIVTVEKGKVIPRYHPDKCDIKLMRWTCFLADSGEVMGGKRKGLAKRVLLYLPGNVPRQPSCLLPTVREEQ